MPFLNAIERGASPIAPCHGPCVSSARADLIAPITWSAAASTKTLRNPNKLKKERVLQVLRDANGGKVSTALLQAVAPHIGVQRAPSRSCAS